MAELTLEQKKAIALANARKRAAEAAAVETQSQSGLPGMIEKVRDTVGYINPIAGMSQSLADSLVDDIRGAPKDDARDTTLGKIDAGMRGAADTMSFGLADEIAAAANAGLNPVLGTGQEGETFSDRYGKNVAIERATDKADAENRFQQRLTGQLAGGAVQGTGLVKSGLSPTAIALTSGKSLPKVMGTAALESGVLGTAQGFGSGEGFEDRLRKAGMSGLFSSVIGGLTPAVVAGAQKAIDPFRAYFNPDAGKDRVMAALMKRSGMTPDDLASSLQASQADDQSMYMAADALGNPGQRIMSTAARTPNDMRKQVVDALLARQMDQGRRIASNLEDASGSILTADQYKQMLKQARATEASKNYAPVMDDVSAIDVSPAVDLANKSISPVADKLAIAREAVPTDLAARAPIEAAEASIRDPIRQAVKEARSYLASDNLTVTNVEKAFRAKTNIDQMINKATENGQGGTVSALLPIQTALDDALAATSKQYASARDTYHTASQNIDAIDVGRDLERGRRRIDDVLSTFGALPSDEAQQAARVGYFDPKIAAAETAKGTMTNAARPFVSEAMRKELPALALPGKGEELMRRLARENTMSETMAQSIGGPSTAQNIADMADSQIDPGVVSALMRGNFKDAALSALTKSVNAARGMPPSVVEKLAPILMETDPQAAQALFSASAKNQSISDQVRARVVAALLSSEGALTPKIPRIAQ